MKHSLNLGLIGIVAGILSAISAYAILGNGENVITFIFSPGTILGIAFASYFWIVGVVVPSDRSVLFRWIVFVVLSWIAFFVAFLISSLFSGAFGFDGPGSPTPIAFFGGCLGGTLGFWLLAVAFVKLCGPFHSIKWAILVGPVLTAISIAPMTVYPELARGIFWAAPFVIYQMGAGVFFGSILDRRPVVSA